MALSHSEVSWWAATEVATFCVGAAIAAWVLGGGTLIHIMAGAGELVEGEPGGAGALVTPQGVVAGGGATGTWVGTFILINTLVPLVVLDVALRAAAPIASQDILAAVLAPVIPVTLIDIFTVQPRSIQREPSLAFAAEAPRSVLTDPLCTTEGRLRPTFIVIDASRVMLGETGRTFTGESPQGVDTEELAVVLFGLTFVEVFARLSVLLQDVPPWAGALVTALGVLADEVAWLWRLRTFIEVYTSCSADVRGVANFAEAPEGAHGVDALAISAEAWHHLTFVDISSISGVSWAVRTYLFVLGGSWKWAQLTLVAPASATVTAALRLCDEVAATGGHLTHCLQYLGEAQTLAVVEAFSAGGTRLESLIALTPVAPNDVNAASIFTDAWLSPAFVLIYTALAIGPAGHAWGADAHEGADQVLAHHASRLAVVQPLGTLVQIFTHLLVFPEGVANWARAFIRSESVHASESTEQRVLGTLVDVFAVHHGPRLKAFIAGAFEAPDHVGARPVPAGVADGALVGVHTPDSSVIQVVAHWTLTSERSISVDALTI